MILQTATCEADHCKLQYLLLHKVFLTGNGLGMCCRESNAASARATKQNAKRNSSHVPACTLLKQAQVDLCFSLQPSPGCAPQIGPGCTRAASCCCRIQPSPASPYPLPYPASPLPNPQGLAESSHKYLLCDVLASLPAQLPRQTHV